MNFRLQEGPTILDKISFRPYRKTQTPMLQRPDVVAYNPSYLSVSFSLNRSPEEREHCYFINYYGEIEKQSLHTEGTWLNNYVDLFTRIERRPWFIVNGDTDILSKLKFTGADLKYLQQRSVAIFLYEPLFCRSHLNERCPAFFDLNQQVSFPELDWIEDFRYNNGLKNVTTYVCDYRLQEYCNRHGLYPNLKIKTWDIFLADLCRSLVTRERYHKSEFFKKGYPFQTNIDKKFICLNYRYEGFRELIMGYLSGSGHIQDGFTSYFHKHDEDHFLNDLPFEANTLSRWPLISEGIQRIQDSLPLTVDTQNSKAFTPLESHLPDSDGKSNQRSDYEIHKWYDQCFLAIVNETRFGTYCGEISEKTLIPIQFMRPFIVVGGPYMLRYLKEMGFETFGDIWDESYDEIEDHRLRMEKIMDVLDDVLSRPLDEMRQTLQNLEQRLHRNRLHFMYSLLPHMHQRLKEDINE